MFNKKVVVPHTIGRRDLTVLKPSDFGEADLTADLCGVATNVSALLSVQSPSKTVVVLHNMTGSLYTLTPEGIQAGTSKGFAKSKERGAYIITLINTTDNTQIDLTDYHFRGEPTSEYEDFVTNLSPKTNRFLGGKFIYVEFVSERELRKNRAIYIPEHDFILSVKTLDEVYLPNRYMIPDLPINRKIIYNAIKIFDKRNAGKRLYTKVYGEIQEVLIEAPSGQSEGIYIFSNDNGRNGVKTLPFARYKEVGLYDTIEEARNDGKMDYVLQSKGYDVKFEEMRTKVAELELKLQYKNSEIQHQQQTHELEKSKIMFDFEIKQKEAMAKLESDLSQAKYKIKLRDSDNRNLELKYKQELFNFNSKMEQSETEHKKKLEIGETEHKRKMENMKSEYETKLSIAKDEHERRMKQAESEFTRKMKSVEVEHTRKMEITETEHERRLEVALKEHERKITLGLIEHERKMVIVDSEHVRKMENSEIEHKHKVASAEAQIEHSQTMAEYAESSSKRNNSLSMIKAVDGVLDTICGIF